jgi:protein subunit release factor A
MNRNEKIRTYNFSRNTIVDHRLGKTKQVSMLKISSSASLMFLQNKPEYVLLSCIVSHV